MLTLPGILIFYSFWTGACLSSNVVLRNKRSDDLIPCEKDSYYFNGKCYRLRGQKKYERLNWNRASTVCKNSGGDLVSIHSQEEQDFLLYFLLMNVQHHTWIGLNDHGNEAQYQWIDGSNLSYTNWDATEPSGLIYGEEDCIMVHFEGEKKNMGKWHDNRCELEYPYICQENPNNERRSPNPIYCSSEEGGGFKYQTSCYSIVLEKKSWEDAEKHCNDNFNGHLVTILDRRRDYFLDYVLRNTSEELWIGIKMRNQLQQKWTSGWHVSYDGFNIKRRNFREDTCVVRKGKKEWTVVPCSENYSFICETSKVIPPVLKPPAKGSYCPGEPYDWRDLDGEYCYHIETLKFVSWYEASFDCRRKGGHLVSLHSKEESDILLQFAMRSTQMLCIGLYRSLPDENGFEWSDGSSLNYENWRYDQPDNKHEKCGEVWAENMFWNDITCSEKRSYICSVKKIQPKLAVTERITDCAALTTTTVSSKTTDSTVLQTSNTTEEIVDSTSLASPTITEETAELTRQIYLKALIGISVSFLLFIIVVGCSMCYFRSGKSERRNNSMIFSSAPLYPNNQSHRPTTVTFSKVPSYPNHQGQRCTPEPHVKDDGHYEVMM